MVETRTFCRISNSAVVQSLLKRTFGFARKKAWDLQKHMYTVKGTYVQACENSTTEQNNSRTSAPYRSDCNYEHRDFIVDSSASLQMMSRNEFISDEKDTIGRPREPTVITSASRESRREQSQRREEEGRM